jgi:hypothetical protein
MADVDQPHEDQMTHSSPTDSDVTVFSRRVGGQ